MSKFVESVKTGGMYTGLGLLMLGVTALALGGPVLTIYGLYGLVTGGGVGVSLIAGPVLWAAMTIGGRKSSAVPMPAMNTAAVTLEGQTHAPLAQKTLAPDFNLDAAVTLGKKIAVRPAIKLKSRPHDLGQP